MCRPESPDGQATGARYVPGRRTWRPNIRIRVLIRLGLQAYGRICLSIQMFNSPSRPDSTPPGLPYYSGLRAGARLVAHNCVLGGFLFIDVRVFVEDVTAVEAWLPQAKPCRLATNFALFVADIRLIWPVGVHLSSHNAPRIQRRFNHHRPGRAPWPAHHRARAHLRPPALSRSAQRQAEGKKTPGR